MPFLTLAQWNIQEQERDMQQLRKWRMNIGQHCHHIQTQWGSHIPPQGKSQKHQLLKYVLSSLTVPLLASKENLANMSTLLFLKTHHSSSPTKPQMVVGMLGPVTQGTEPSIVVIKGQWKSWASFMCYWHNIQEILPTFLNRDNNITLLQFQASFSTYKNSKTIV
jgi:hypothetical protein